MQVVVLAGGMGTRLRPITEKIPKCMAAVGDKPFLFYLLRLLKSNGADEVMLCTGYLGEQVETYFGDGKAMGLKLLYSREKGGLLGTGGALKLAETLLADSFLVINGDTYIELDYHKVFYTFMAEKCPAFIVASPCYNNTRCDISIDTDMMVTRYDKNASGLEYVNAGVMGLRQEVIASVEPDRNISLEADIFPPLIACRRVKAFITRQKFYDIGSPAGLSIFERAIREQAK